VIYPRSDKREEELGRPETCGERRIVEMGKNDEEDVLIL
jgi:hypothetical protein